MADNAGISDLKIASRKGTCRTSSRTPTGVVSNPLSHSSRRAVRRSFCFKGTEAAKA